MNKINAIFSLLVLLFLKLGFQSCTAQSLDKYKPLSEVPELNELDELNPDLHFKPKPFKNMANGTQAEIIFQNTDPSFQFFNDVMFVDPNKGILVGGTNLAIRVTEDAGRSWKQMDYSRAEGAFHSVAKTKDHVFVVGESEYIFRSDLNMEDWEVYDSKGIFPEMNGIVWYKLRFLDSKFGILVGGHKGSEKPLLATTNDAGRTWNAIALANSPLKQGMLKDVAILDSNNWVVIDEIIGRTYQTTDAGRTWTEISSNMLTDTDATLKTLCLLNPKELYGAGARTFWFSNSFGKQWDRLELPLPYNADENYNVSDDLNFTSMSKIADDLYISSSAENAEEGRYVLAYKLDRKNKKLIPLIKAEQAIFSDEAFAIYALDKDHIYIMDRKQLIRVKDR